MATVGYAHATTSVDRKANAEGEIAGGSPSFYDGTHYFNIWDLEDQDDDLFGYGGGLDEEDDTAASNGGSEDMRKRPHVVSVGPAHTAASVDQKATAVDKKAEEGVSYYGKDHMFGIEEFDGFEFGGNPRLEESNEGGGPKMTKAAHKRGRERRAEAATRGDGGPSPCDHPGGPASYRRQRRSRTVRKQRRRR